MSPLSNKQKQLLFDYCIDLTSEEQTAEAEALISCNEEAAEIHSKLEAAFAPLEAAEPQLCPDELAERTILRLNNLARSSQLQLQQLLTAEQGRTVTARSRFWRNLGEVAAVAAVIVFATVVLLPTLRRIRQDSWRKHQCQMQLARIFQGLNNYSNDHNGKLPAVATAAGAPWWKVGDQGKENYSNTRHIWLLVKGGYVNPTDFICPGTRPGRVVIKLDLSKMKNYNDFPARRYVTFSFRIKPSKPTLKRPVGRRVLIADLNPLFEQLPDNYSESFTLEPPKNLLTINSINHNRRGQNVLFRDGGVDFLKSRRVGTAEDDIFTLQDTDIYQGVEVPSHEDDVFLAP